MQQLVDGQTRLLDYSAEAHGLDAYYEKSLSMLNSKRIRQAFDLSQEPDKLRDSLRPPHLRAKLPAWPAGWSRRACGSSTSTSPTPSAARARPAAAGTRTASTTRGCFPIVEKRHFPITEQTLPTFLNDLDDRGLLDTTLVVWMGEFGRTPKINENISRDHWPQCYTVLLAGGGVKRGYVYGASDKHGEFPARDPVRPDDLAATMFHLLGIDPETEVRDPLDRPFPIAAGKPIRGVMG